MDTELSNIPDETVRQVINFASANLSEFSFLLYVGNLDTGLLQALNDLTAEKPLLISVQGFHALLPPDPHLYPNLKFLIEMEGSVASDLMIHDAAWTSGYRIESVTDQYPPKLLVLIGDGIKDALISKYDWEVSENVAFGRLNNPNAKWWTERT